MILNSDILRYSPSPIPSHQGRGISNCNRDMLIDTHCHLDFPEFDADRDLVIKRAQESGIGYIINVGSSVLGSRRSLQLAKDYDFIYPVVGIHPHEADSIKDDDYLAIKDLAADKKVVAIGEIGLDYYKNYSNPVNQEPLFVNLLKLAKELDLPVVVHTRDAQVDTVRILKQVSPKGALVHCFSGDRNFLRECLDLGFYVSFTCNITYKKAQDLRDLVKFVPMDRVLLETDAPYLPLQELRGKRNEPAYIKNLAQEVSLIRGISPEEVALATTNNAKYFFGIK